jgi:type IV secretion system protein VirD4
VREAIELGRYLNGAYDPYNGSDKLRYTGERHLLLLGVNGAGKGTRILMPNLLTMHGNRSIVVVDPKGELAAVTAPFRRQVSRVVILNPFGVLTEYQGYQDLEGCGFNPLAALDPRAEDFSEEAALLADAMIAHNPNAKDPHWDNSARALVAAVIMFVVIIARQNRFMPTIAQVRQLICEASEGANPKNNFEPRGIPARALEMMRSSLAGLRNKAAQFTDWNREIQSVASTARIQTEMFDSPQLSRNLAANDFDFAEIKRQPTTVYLILPPQLIKRQGKWLRLVLTSALQSATRSRRAGEPSILFMLDEFAALGHLQIIEDYWAQVRGYGIQMMPVLQDLSQLKSIYSDRWESFVANAGVIMSFAANDHTTAEWLSKRTGQTTRMMTTTSYNRANNRGNNTGQSWNNGQTGGTAGGSLGDSYGWSESSNSNTTPTKVPMMLPQEFYGMPRGVMMVSVEGSPYPIFADAPGYFEIRATDSRARLNPYIPSHNVPLDPRRQQRRMGDMPTWDWGQPQQPQEPPAVGGWGGTGDAPDMFDQMFGGKRPAPSPDPFGGGQASPWWSRPALPSPPARRRLPPPEDWEDFPSDDSF